MEEYRPSLQEKAIKAVVVSLKELGIRACGETVKAVLYCEECDKPRCVYANKKLSAEQTLLLRTLEEEVAFVCGSKFIPEDHPLYKVCCVLDGVLCMSDVSPHYYSSSSRLHFPSVCYVCGGTESIRSISQEDFDNYQSIRHVCETCFETGHSKKEGESAKGGKGKFRDIFQCDSRTMIYNTVSHMSSSVVTFEIDDFFLVKC